MLDGTRPVRLGADRLRFVGGDSSTDGSGSASSPGRSASTRGWRQALHRPAATTSPCRARSPANLLRELIWDPAVRSRRSADLDKLGSGSRSAKVFGRAGGAWQLNSCQADRFFTAASSDTSLWCTRSDATGAVGGRRVGAGGSHDLDQTRARRPLDHVGFEAGLIFAGYEFCDQVDPFEAGHTAFHRAAEEQGKTRLRRQPALERAKASRSGHGRAGNGGPRAAGHGDSVHVGRSQVGRVTQRQPGRRYCAKNIALWPDAVEYSEAGTEVEVGNAGRATANAAPGPGGSASLLRPDKDPPRLLGPWQLSHPACSNPGAGGMGPAPGFSTPGSLQAPGPGASAAWG